MCEIVIDLQMKPAFKNRILTSARVMGFKQTRIKPWCTGKGAKKEFSAVIAPQRHTVQIPSRFACNIPTELMKLHSTGPLEAMATSTFRMDLQQAVCIRSLYWGKMSICTTRRRSSSGVYTSGTWWREGRFERTLLVS